MHYHLELVLVAHSVKDFSPADQLEAKIQFDFGYYERQIYYRIDKAKS